VNESQLLLVEDDPEISESLADYLRGKGFGVQVAGSAEAGHELLARGGFDLVLLDVMLPGEDGLSFCRRVRASGGPPIIMLTALSEPTDKVVGLELGADDYVSKPFEPRELMARMQAVLRRSARTREDRVRVGPLDLNWTTSVVSMNGRRLSLTPAEFELLGVFVRNRGRVLSRDRILDDTHGIDLDAYDRSIDVLVSRLRQKLGDDPKQPRFIRTVRGTGYRFTGDSDE
jgi:two-component system OmpR family response regulator